MTSNRRWRSRSPRALEEQASKGIDPDPSATKAQLPRPPQEVMCSKICDHCNRYRCLGNVHRDMSPHATNQHLCGRCFAGAEKAEEGIDPNLQYLISDLRKTNADKDMKISKLSDKLRSAGIKPDFQSIKQNWRRDCPQASDRPATLPKEAECKGVESRPSPKGKRKSSQFMIGTVGRMVMTAAALAALSSGPIVAETLQHSAVEQQWTNDNKIGFSKHKFS